MSFALGSPSKGPMTQGTIFTCAKATDYLGCSAYGLVITARCDIAHGKTQIYNYLPVVRLNDWLHRDGRLILAQRALAEASGQMRSILKEAGLSQEILETENPRIILNSVLVGNFSKFRERYEKQCVRLEVAERCIKSEPSKNLCLEVARDSPKLKDKLILELVHNTLNGYYFLPTVEPNGDELGHVVLLREIQGMPQALAIRIADGLTTDFYESLCSSEPSVREILSIAYDDFALPVGQLLSPHLEHLLQTLAYLFSRIGLPDPDKAYIENLWNTQPSVAGTSEGSA